MRTLLLLSCILLLFTGCSTSSTILVSPDEAPTRYDEINRRAERLEAQLVLQDGTTRYVYNLHVTADSTSWGAEADIVIATESIQEIAFRSRSMGTAARGLGMGLLAGAAAGGLLGSIGGAQDDFFSPIEGAALGALGGAFWGGLVGLVAGIDGHKQIYRLSGPPPQFVIGDIPYSLMDCDPPREQCRQYRYYYQNTTRGGELIGEPGWDESTYREAAERAILRYLQLVKE